MAAKKEKAIVIELYNLWNQLKARFNIISPQPKSFELLTTVQPITNIDDFYIKLVDLSDSTSIAAGNDHTVTLEPPDGECYQIIDWMYDAPDPAGSSSGSQKLEAWPMGQTSGTKNEILQVTGTFGNGIYVGDHCAFNGTSESPSAGSEQFNIIHGSLWATHEAPITFIYDNSTDVAQAGNRKLLLMVKVFKNVI